MIKITSSKTNHVPQHPSGKKATRMALIQLPQFEEYREMIATLAYQKAEKRGFLPGHEVADWLAAEREVSRCFPGIDF